MRWAWKPTGPRTDRRISGCGDPIEVGGHGALQYQQTKSSPGGIGGVVVGPGQAGDLHQGLTGFTNYETLARNRLRHEPGEMGLGLVQVGLAHGSDGGMDLV